MRLRTVLEQESVVRNVTRAKAEFKRIDEAYAGLQWRLSRDPHAGYEFEPGFYVYKQVGLPSVGVPTLTVIYQFDEQTIEFRGIRISAEP